MAKFLALWRFNPNAPWPTDPNGLAMGMEQMFAKVDNNLKSGEVLEFGYFADGKSGYSISTGESKDVFRRVFANFPWLEADVHEMIPYETGKEIVRGVLKAEAMKR